MTAATTTDPRTIPYEDLCARLGVDPAVNFVEVTEDGTITYTAGKPEEIRSLARAARREGFDLDPSTYWSGARNA